MSLSSKIVLFIAIVSLNVAILIWRYSSQADQIIGVGPTVAELGQLQVEMVTAWRNASSISFDQDQLREFAETLQWNRCGATADGIDLVNETELSDAEREDLRQALVELLDAYSRDKVDAIYDYMSSRCGSITPTMTNTLLELLDGEELDSQSPSAIYDAREIMKRLAGKVQYRTRWVALASGTGCVRVWRPTVGQEVLSTPPGGHMVGLFKNQTRYHQLFETPALKTSERGAASPPLIVADVQFVVQHDESLQYEPSPYFVRFILNRAEAKWQPTEMIHVPTISGNSPTLLF